MATLNSKFMMAMPEYSPGKTKVISIINKKTLFPLGVIRWYGAWRAYCFEPYDGCVFSSGCLTDLTHFLDELNREQKEQKS